MAKRWFGGGGGAVDFPTYGDFIESDGETGSSKGDEDDERDEGSEDLIGPLALGPGEWTGFFLGGAELGAAPEVDGRCAVAIGSAGVTAFRESSLLAPALNR